MKLIATAVVLTLVLATAAVCATHFHNSEALDALYYCKAAYCPSKNLPNWTCPTCVLHHTNFTSIQVQENKTMGFLAFTGYNPDNNQIVLAFRGSHDLKNWLKNLDYKHTSYPKCDGCEVHRGFYETWQSVEVPVIKSLNALISTYSGASVLVAGHSLGAAVSVLGAIDVITQTSASDVRLYSFGTPRVGNPTFVAWAAKQFPGGKQFRITHEADPVPHVPPMDMGFLHVPHELWFDNNGDSTWKDCKDSATAEDPNCSDSVRFPIDLRDHIMYLGRCTHCENQPNAHGKCPL